MQNYDVLYPFIPQMPPNPLYAHAYVPFQYTIETYETVEACEKGTLYPELFQPYATAKSLEHIYDLRDNYDMEVVADDWHEAWAIKPFEKNYESRVRYFGNSIISWHPPKRLKVNYATQ